MGCSPCRSASTEHRTNSPYFHLGVSHDSSDILPKEFADIGIDDRLPMLRKQFVTLTLGGLSVQNPQIDIVPDNEGDAFRMEHSTKSRDDPVYGYGLKMENLDLGMNVLSKLYLYIAYKEHRIYLAAADAR